MGQQNFDFYGNKGPVTVNNYNGDPDNPNQTRDNAVTLKAKDDFLAMVKVHQLEWKCSRSAAIVELAIIGHNFLKIRGLKLEDIEKMDKVFRKLTPSQLNELLKD